MFGLIGLSDGGYVVVLRDFESELCANGKGRRGERRRTIRLQQVMMAMTASVGLSVIPVRGRGRGFNLLSATGRGSRGDKSNVQLYPVQVIPT